MTQALSQIRTYQQFIGGEFVDAASGETLAVENPANGQVIAHVPASLQGGRRPRGRRGRDRLRDLEPDDAPGPQPDPAQDRRHARRERRRARPAGVAEPGKPVGAAIDEMAVSSDLFRFFAGACRVMEGLAANEYLAGHTSMIRRDPIGVVASIAPWNYPLYMAAWKLGPGARDRQHGRAQAVRPDAAVRPALRRDPRRAAAARRGQRPVRLGRATSATTLVGHPKVRMVSITGDTVTGKRIAAIAADTVKRLHLELGGKAPVIVFDDADVELAAETLQVRRLLELRPGLHRGHPRHRRPGRLRQVRRAPWRTRSGPSSGATRPRATTSRWARSSRRPRPTRSRAWSTGRARRAEVVVGGDRPDRPGAYYEPTVIAGPDQRSRDHPGRGLRAGRHGPALQRRGPGDRVGERRPLRPRGSVFTSDIGKAMRVAKALQFGTVWINEHFTLVVRDPARRRQGVRLGQGRLQVRARGLHGHQAHHDQALSPSGCALIPISWRSTRWKYGEAVRL